MALTKNTDDLDIIQALGDRPNQTDGLSAAQMKAKYDEAVNLLKDFINDVLTVEIDANFATKADLVAAVLSGVADDSLTTAKMATEQKRAVANGVASLDATANVPLAQLGKAVTEINTVDGKLTTHKSSTDHDGRYYTEGEVDTLLTSYIAKSIIDAAGDLIVGTADNTPAKFTKGSANQILRVKSDASTIEWADQTIRKIAEATINNDSYIDFTSIPSGFKSLVLEFRGKSSDTVGTTCYLRAEFNSVGSGYYGSFNLGSPGNPIYGVDSTSSASAVLGTIPTSHATNHGGAIGAVKTKITHVSGSYPTTLSEFMFWRSASSNAIAGQACNACAGINTEISSIRVSCSAGNLSTGYLVLYGIV